MPKQGKKLYYKLPLMNMEIVNIIKSLEVINRAIIDQTMPQQCWEIPWQQQYWETRERWATKSLNNIICLLVCGHSGNGSQWNFILF